MSRAPLVQLLGEYGETDLTQEKPITSSRYTKYTNLEEAAFVHSGHSRDDFSLHFHLESHNRCEVKLKPNLWDRGVYFVPKLLKEGALQLVPHFTQRHRQSYLPQKRAAPSLDLVDGPAITRHPRKTNLGLGHLLEVSRPGIKAVERSECGARKENLRARVRQSTQQSVDTKKHRPSLPSTLNFTTWTRDFARLKQKIFDTQYDGVVPKSGEYLYRHAAYRAHKHLIDGDYGIAALVSCEKCAMSGVSCRVYHPECYKWHSPGRSAKADLGWRCSNCRVGGACVLSGTKADKAVEPHDVDNDSEESLHSTIIATKYTSNHDSNDIRLSAKLKKSVNSLRNLPPLPASVTQDTWVKDFDAAKKQYTESHRREGAAPKRSNECANRFAHQELIRGRYGVRAAMACESCSDQEQECRTYHPECYQWVFDTLPARETLGWRCSGCRSQSHWAACNVQWEREL